MPLRFWAISLLSLMVVNLLGGCVDLRNESRLILPANIDEPVFVQLPDNKIDWETADPSNLLQVYVGQEDICCEDQTPMAGRYAFNGDKLVFTPAFPFVTGQDYVARLQMPNGQEGWIQERTTFTIAPVTPLVDAKVTGIYPSGNVLPENVLRFYIHFARPMKPHVAFEYIKLLDASGNADEAAFMRFKQELWNEDRTRLTLLMDPGRIKREVATNIQLGPALRAGKRYELMIEEGWPTADGTSQLAAFSKPFVVAQALRELPDSEAWDITVPGRGTQQMIAIRFDRPFDYQLLLKDIHVLSEDGQKIPGEIQIGEHEYEWHFLPKHPWSAEKILIVVNSELEDVAGNNFKDLLDHKVDTETKSHSQISIPLRLKGLGK